MNKVSLVSVIIPNYCHSRYLDERIKSVLCQTYNAIEIIILDDCSPDEGASRKVIEKYRENPRVSHIIYNEKNTGSPFIQWEKGLLLAQGEICWIAESDDSCDSTFLEKLVKAYEETGAVLAFCKSKRMDENGVLYSTFNMQKGLKKNFCKDGRRFNSENMSIVNSVMNASSAIFSRKAALQIDRQYMNYKGSGDWLFWIELAEMGKVFYLNESLNYFRQHITNTTSQTVKSGLNIIENKKVFDYLITKKEVNRLQILRRRVYSSWAIKYFYNHLDKKQKNKYLNLWNYNQFIGALAFLRKARIDFVYIWNLMIGKK